MQPDRPEVPAQPARRNLRRQALGGVAVARCSRRSTSSKRGACPRPRRLPLLDPPTAPGSPVLRRPSRSSSVIGRPSCWVCFFLYVFFSLFPFSFLYFLFLF